MDIVKYLVEEAKQDASEVDLTDEGPIHVAAQEGYLDIVKYLVEEAHVNPEMASDEGQTPLHLAAMGGSLGIVEYLVEEARVDVDKVDNNGDTPYQVADSWQTHRCSRIPIDATLVEKIVIRLILFPILLYKRTQTFSVNTYL